MAERTKTKEITIVDEAGTFNILLKPFWPGTEYGFESLSLLRKLLSNEKAKILHIIKKKSPNSIYKLAKLVNRDFKSVSEDVKLLKKFGFIDMVAEKSGNRKRLKPVLVIDNLKINIKI